MEKLTDIEILYEDDAVIVCYKPAGIATQTNRLGQQDMESLLKNYRAKKGEEPYIGVVHRLDQPVEGIMVFAKNRNAAANLSKQVQQREIGKHYYAIAGMPASKKLEGVLVDYLLFDKKTNRTNVVDVSTRSAQMAKLEYKILRTYWEQGGDRELALYDIMLDTGRHHQIRVQFANMGCPLLGDAKYGDYNDRTTSMSALALCSYRLEFLHPVTGKKMDIKITPANPVFRE